MLDTPRQFNITVLAILGLTALLIVAVVAHDRAADVATIEHFVDFHLDTDRIVEDAKKEQEAKVQSKKDYDAFVKDVKFWENDRSSDCSSSNDNQRGCIGPPDRDK